MSHRVATQATAARAVERHGETRRVYDRLAQTCLRAKHRRRCACTNARRPLVREDLELLHLQALGRVRRWCMDQPGRAGPGWLQSTARHGPAAWQRKARVADANGRRKGALPCATTMVVPSGAVHAWAAVRPFAPSSSTTSRLVPKSSFSTTLRRSAQASAFRSKSKQPRAQKETSEQAARRFQRPTNAATGRRHGATMMQRVAT